MAIQLTLTNPFSAQNVPSAVSSIQILYYFPSSLLMPSILEKNKFHAGNSDGDYHLADQTALQKVDNWGFHSYKEFMGIFSILLICYTFTMVCASILYDGYCDNMQNGIGGESPQQGDRGV